MKRFAIIGIGQRAGAFVEGLLNDHSDHASLVALCDASMPALEARAKPWQENGAKFALYSAADFDRMIDEQKPDEIVVLTPDHTHDEYICRSMERGCDVIVEKPMVTSIEQCQHVIDVQKKTRHNCRVTFNYRYSPWNTCIKEALLGNILGRITSVTRRHTLGHAHGPAYYHRWHGERPKSGGLLVHKSTHYLDLINWFVASVPETVFAIGGRYVFTEDHAQALGIVEKAPRCEGCPSAGFCPFYRDYTTQGEPLPGVEARGKETGYYRDDCVFRDAIDVPDTSHVMVKYESGTILSYSKVAFGGGGSDEMLIGTHGMLQTTGHAPSVTPFYGEPYELKPEKRKGGHGGADPVLFDDLYNPNPPEDPNRRAANQFDGAWSILIGLAAYKSMDTGKPVRIRDLVTGLELPAYAREPKQPEGFETSQMRAWVDKHERAKRERKAKNQQTLADTFSPDR